MNSLVCFKPSDQSDADRCFNHVFTKFAAILDNENFFLLYHTRSVLFKPSFSQHRSMTFLAYKLYISWMLVNELERSEIK